MSCRFAIRVTAANASAAPPTIRQTRCADEWQVVAALADLAARSCCSLNLVSLILFSLILPPYDPASRQEVESPTEPVAVATG
jgi:hypothetical protein